MIVTEKLTPVADLIGPDTIVRHVHREQLDGVRFGPVVRGLYETHRPAFFTVELAGQQKIHIDQLRQAGIPVRAVRPVGDKETRSISLQVRMEAGQVWIPAGATWFGELQSELLAFPRGRFDDQVDMLSQIAGLGRYAARPEPSEEERAEKAKKAEADHWQRMLMAGI